MDVWVRAFARARSGLDRRLVIAGPDDEGLTASLKRIATQLGVGVDVTSLSQSAASRGSLRSRALTCGCSRLTQTASGSRSCRRSMIVTVNYPSGVYGPGLSIGPVVLDGAASSTIVGGKNAANGNNVVPSDTLTPDSTGSLVFGHSVVGYRTSAGRPARGQTSLGSVTDTGCACDSWYQYQTALTNAGAGATVSDTNSLPYREFDAVEIPTATT